MKGMNGSKTGREGGVLATITGWAGILQGLGNGMAGMSQCFRRLSLRLAFDFDHSANTLVIGHV